MLDVAADPSELDGAMALAEVEIALEEGSSTIEGFLNWNSRDGTVMQVDLFLGPFRNLGAAELQQLDGVMGTPSGIYFARLTEGQIILLEYLEYGTVVRLWEDSHGDVCLASKPVGGVDIFLHEPRDTESIVEREGLSPVDLASQRGISTEGLWEALQTPTNCIPAYY